jgi:hypothetical protein
MPKRKGAAMIQAYYVSVCDEGNGRRTWDVIRRTVRMRGANGNAVSNHDTRAQARAEAARLNG